MTMPEDRPVGTGQVVKDEASSTANRAREATGEVAGTAREQVRQVSGEAGAQARQVISRVRDRVGEETQSQTERAAHGLRQWADDLASMADSSKPDSPVRGAVHQIADGGRRAADYLERRGVGGAVEEVQEFARRRPAAFLAGAVVAGFVAGRLAKAATGRDRPSGSGSPSFSREEGGHGQAGYQEAPYDQGTASRSLPGRPEYGAGPQGPEPYRQGAHSPGAGPGVPANDPHPGPPSHGARGPVTGEPVAPAPGTIPDPGSPGSTTYPLGPQQPPYAGGGS